LLRKQKIEYGIRTMNEDTFKITSCTLVSSSHVETVKCLINKDYRILISNNVKNCTY
jgi:hypothetical protein